MQNWKKSIIATVVLLAIGLFTPLSFSIFLAIASFLTSIVAYLAEERMF